MELQLFIYKNIAIHFFYSKDSLDNNTVNVKNIFIYFPGLPQIMDEDFFIDKVNKNTAFFSVYYLGSWLSGEKFTYENCKKTVNLAIEFVKHKKGIKTFDNKFIYWNYDNLNVIGYSFSGNIVLSTKILKKDVKNILLFAPLIFLYKNEASKYLKDKKNINDFYKFNLFYLEFLRRGYKFALKGIEQKSWDAYFSGKNQKTIIKIDNSYPNIFIFHGKIDKKIKYTSSLFFQEKKCSNAKITLIDGVGHSLEGLFDINKLNKLI